jgi:hypothetical protein
MSKEQIDVAADSTQAERLTEWRQTRVEPPVTHMAYDLRTSRRPDNRFITDAVDSDAAAGVGPASDDAPRAASGTIRVLVAAVQRLSEENMALADEVAHLRRQGQGVTIFGGFNPEGLETLSRAEYKRLLYGYFPDVASSARENDGSRGLESIADPEAWGNPEAFEAFRAEMKTRAEAHRAEVEAEYQAAVDGHVAVPVTAENEIDVYFDEDVRRWGAQAAGVSPLMAFGLGDSDREAAAGLFTLLRTIAKLRQVYLDEGYPTRVLDRVADLVAREDELMTTLFLRLDADDTAADYRPGVGAG